MIGVSELLQGFLAVGRLLDDVTLVGKDIAHALADVLIIVDDQHATIPIVSISPAHEHESSTGAAVA